MSADPNHFELFGLPVDFHLDPTVLEHAYHRALRHAHPDRQADGQARGLATRWSARLNQAYATLKTPLNRAIYLLQLSQIDVHSEQQTVTDMVFLEQQMAWREALASCETLDAATKGVSLAQLAVQLEEAIEQRQAAFAACFPPGLPALTLSEREAAARRVREWIFTDRLHQQVRRGLRAA